METQKTGFFIQFFIQAHSYGPYESWDSRWTAILHSIDSVEATYSDFANIEEGDIIFTQKQHVVHFIMAIFSSEANLERISKLKFLM